MTWLSVALGAPSWTHSRLRGMARGNRRWAEKKPCERYTFDYAEGIGTSPRWRYCVCGWPESQHRT